MWSVTDGHGAVRAGIPRREAAAPAETAEALAVTPQLVSRYSGPRKQVAASQ